VALNLYAIPPNVPFLDAVARAWLVRSSDPLEMSQGLILLPTRRAARSLVDAFLRQGGGRALLLPRITAFGALDEAPLALSGALDLPPAIDPMQRLAALARLILGMRGSGGAPQTADRAWQLAAELAALMDEAERAEVDLASRLPDAADPAYAAHWAETLRFLQIVTHAWPAYLAENGVMNPAARQVALLDAQAASWQACPPAHRVLVAGTTAGIPAVARLLKVVAGLPVGEVVLPALDTTMSERAWGAIDEPHPQAGLARLLADLGATRGDVQRWPATLNSEVPPGRFATLSTALLPADALVWDGGVPPSLEGLKRLVPADQQEEAAAIAVVMRQALETPSTRVALVTPDRDLAGRVAAELRRFGVIADDSAGEQLAETPPAVLLRLLARAVAEELAPVPLLALLKHPLVGAGLAPAACRTEARALELAALRGPRPGPAGIQGLRRALAKAGERPQAFLARLETCLEPVLRFAAPVEVAPVAAMAALIEAAERLAATDETDGTSRLWSGEEGEALANLLSSLRAAIGILPDQRPSVLPGLLDAVLAGVAVRTRRALRGSGTGTVEHPRVFIWGLLEARLQSAELLILGGLAEGVWPPAPEPGPWLSRPMRKAVGLPSPEQSVGQSAHDFLAATCAAPLVVLSCPARRDAAPAVPSRWLTRLDMLLEGRGLALRRSPATAWIRALDLPANGPIPVLPPQPRPPLGLRPRRLSVTAIETWLRDPYAIYARHILRLSALRPLDEATDAADYGSLVHDGLHRFLADNRAAWPNDARDQLRNKMEIALRTAGLRAALAAWWAPRLERIADWIAETETARRQLNSPVSIESEIAGDMLLARPGGAFRLTGRADRIERRHDGTLAILDYKTGTPPSQQEVEAGLAPQLLLEAAMAAVGGFGAAATGHAAELIYWHLTGGFVAGEARSLFRGKEPAIAEAVAAAECKLGELIDAFDQFDRAYLAHPHPDWAPRFSDYAQLARVAEWSAAGEDA
jgi:ATP-dependent helicase/nuclease subunit B